MQVIWAAAAEISDAGPTLNWVGFASGVFGAILGSITQLLVHYSQSSREASRKRRDAFASFESEVLNFVKTMSRLPVGATPSHEAVFEMYALQSAAQRLRKRRGSWWQKEAAKRVDSRILQMSNYRNITQLGILHNQVVILLQEWESRSFHPDQHPLDLEAAFYPDFPMQDVNGALAFPVAQGATTERSGVPTTTQEPKSRRRLFGLLLPPVNPDSAFGRAVGGLKRLRKRSTR